MKDDPESRRLHQDPAGWKRWGPYLAERAWGTAVEAFEGQGSKLKAIKTRDLKTGVMAVIHPAAAFIFIGQMPNTGFLKNYLELDKYGYIRTGHDFVHDKGNKANVNARAFETSVPGMFAAGDVRYASVKQVASAVGEGAAASISIRDFLRKN